MEPDQESQSRYLGRYRDLMGRDGQDHHFGVPSQEQLKKYRAELVSAESLASRRRKYDLRLTYSSRNASTAIYVVDLGRFRMTINLLNLQGKSPVKLTEDVLFKEVHKTTFVAKIIKRKENSPE